jgi:hypothetical protein
MEKRYFYWLHRLLSQQKIERIRDNVFQRPLRSYTIPPDLVHQSRLNFLREEDSNGGRYDSRDIQHLEMCGHYALVKKL